MVLGKGYALKTGCTHAPEDGENPVDGFSALRRTSMAAPLFSVL